MWTGSACSAPNGRPQSTSTASIAKWSYEPTKKAMEQAPLPTGTNSKIVSPAVPGWTVPKTPALKQSQPGQDRDPRVPTDRRKQAGADRERPDVHPLLQSTLQPPPGSVPVGGAAPVGMLNAFWVTNGWRTTTSNFWTWENATSVALTTRKRPDSPRQCCLPSPDGATRKIGAFGRRSDCPHPFLAGQRRLQYIQFL